MTRLDEVHCLPGCTEHQEHYFVVQVQVGPLPEPVRPIADGPLDVLATEVMQLAGPQSPHGADVDVSSFLCSGESLGHVAEADQP